MLNNHHYQDTSMLAINASSSNDTERGGKRKRGDDDEYESMDEARQAVLRCLMDLHEDDSPREADGARAAIDRSGGVAPAIIYDSETRYQRAAAAATDLPRLVPCHKKRKTNRSLQPKARLPLCRNTTAKTAMGPSFDRDCWQEDNIGAIDLTATDTEDDEEQDDGNQGKTNAILQENIDDEEEEGIDTQEEEEYGDDNNDDLDGSMEEETDEEEASEEYPDSVEREVMLVTDPRQQEWDRLWEEKFQLLVVYKEKHKTTKVPVSNPVLGVWVQNQRRQYRKKKLSDIRIQRLNSIGFQWAPNKDRPAWKDMYNRLVQYYNDHGTTIVSLKKDPKLNQWVHKQRHYCKNPQRISLLNKIGFKWEIRQYNRVPWMDMYHRLVTYYNDHGTTILSKQDDLKLYHWANYQRQKCKEPQKILLLNKIGFRWPAKRKDDPTILGVQDTILL